MFLSNHDDAAGDETLVTVGDTTLSFQSVIPRVNGDDIECAVVDQSTSWLAPTNMKDNLTPSATDITLKVGDTIRVGAVEDGLTGYSDYLMIMEVQGPITKVYNGMKATIQIGPHETNDTLAEADAVVLSTSSSFTSRYMYRVNSTLNATKLPDFLPDTSLNDAGGLNDPNWYKQLEYVSLEENAAGRKDINHSNRFRLTNVPHHVYKMNYPNTTELKLTLDRGIGTVHRITLIGYHIKSSDSGLFDTESRSQDYYTLRIKELQGGAGVISNKPTPNGCFAVISTGHSVHRTIGAIEYEMHDTVSGIASALVNSSQPLKTLTVEVLNMNGELAKVNKLHLWFKLLTTSC